MTWVQRGDFTGPKGTKGNTGAAGARGAVGPTGYGAGAGAATGVASSSTDLSASTYITISNLVWDVSPNNGLYTTSTDGITINKAGVYTVIGRVQIRAVGSLSLRINSSTNARYLGQSIKGANSAWTMAQVFSTFYATAGSKITLTAWTELSTSNEAARTYLGIFGVPAA